ncbi:hypothetical protein [Lutibaculum baratangense]|uniref:Uncharacterized protein n=1 Tax=Lutibaculum baratangense AMV1 TaxID=631454 RepID=V4RH36_9HYPH|nr:hypothetical protein [Lutibaculum baratangense]ESR25431.1 hypothetical protein N177_1726 [Lutibaculum baratangense AMV1]
MTSPRSPKSSDVLISRILIGKPDATVDDIRRLVPQAAGLDDKALRQKIEYLRKHRKSKAPL